MKKIFIYGDKRILTNYEKALKFCHARPIISDDLQKSVDCQGLILAGGGDILPSFYGAENTASFNIDTKRDLDEIDLVEDFISSNRPILGICRGIQIINVALGGDLTQETSQAKSHSYDPTKGDQIHPVVATSGSVLHELYGTRFSVNSAHHQALDKLAYGLHVSCLSEDGVIEAVESANRRILGIQFHPERMCGNLFRKDTVDGRKLFDYFLSIC